MLCDWQCAFLLIFSSLDVDQHTAESAPLSGA